MTTPAVRTFDALISESSELRRAYYTMLSERRTTLVAHGFETATTPESLEHARGGVAMLDLLLSSAEKERTDGNQRSRYLAAAR